MAKMIDKLLGKDEDKKAEDREDRHYRVMGQQHTTDIATANEPLDHQAQDQRSDLLKWQQDLDDEIIKLRHRLKSEVKYTDGSWRPKEFSVWNEETGKTEMRIVPSLANDLFVDYIETQCEPFLSRNLFSSNLNEKRILEILRNTCDDIADAMADSFDRYGIEFINYDIVMRLIKNVIIPGPFRALNDGQRRHDRTIAKRIEAFADRDTGKIKKKTLMGVDIG